MSVNVERSYLLCATPRSGSTLLCEILAGTGQMGRPKEYFEYLKDTGLPRQPSQYFCSTGMHPKQIDSILALLGFPEVKVDRHRAERMRGNYSEYLSHTLRLGCTANGVFGAKIMWGHLSDFLSLATGDSSTSSGRRIDTCLQTLFKGLRYVHVVRRDKLRQAVSLWRAIQTQRWRRDAGKPQVKPWRSPIFDFTAIETLRQQIVEHDLLWNRFFSAAGIVPLVVDYEHFVNNPAATYCRMAEYVGIEIQDKEIYHTGMVKQAGPESEQWISEYLQILRSKQRQLVAT